ncbi:MAG: hypothetical protein KKD31_13030 [Bacteroidetes bacterium]|nr:hypothetical protein [Bacteroidota bacterium]
MQNFKSKPTQILQKQEKIFYFLSDFSNFRHLLPDEVTNWENDTDWCVFSLRGIPKIRLEMHEKVPASKVTYISGEGTPIKFSIHNSIEELGPDLCQVQVVIQADLNPVLQMLASKPLQNLVEMLAEKLKEEGEKL